MKDLVNVCVEQAIFFKEEWGEFYPFAFSISSSGTLAILARKMANDQPDAKDVVNELEAIINVKKQDKEVIEVAMCLDVLVTKAGESSAFDAFQMRVARRNGKSEDVFFPYRIHEDGYVVLGEMYVETATLRW